MTGNNLAIIVLAAGQDEQPLADAGWDHLEAAARRARQDLSGSG